MTPPHRRLHPLHLLAHSEVQVTRATRSLAHECQDLRPRFYPSVLFSHRKRRMQSRYQPWKGPSLARSSLSGKPLGPGTLSHQNFVVPQRAATVPTPRIYCFDSLSPACHLAYLTLHIPDYSPGQNHIFPTEEDYRKGAKIQRGQGRECGFLRKTPSLNSTQVLHYPQRFLRSRQAATQLPPCPLLVRSHGVPVDCTLPQG